MAQRFPSVAFERYVDDAVVHCRSEAQAHLVAGAIAERMEQVGLQLHPDKTRIVYCKDGRRVGSAEHTAFDFLGYTFRARAVRSRHGNVFTGFGPAVSKGIALAERRKRHRGPRLLGSTPRVCDQSVEPVGPFAELRRGDRQAVPDVGMDWAGARPRSSRVTSGLAVRVSTGGGCGRRRSEDARDLSPRRLHADYLATHFKRRRRRAASQSHDRRRPCSEACWQRLAGDVPLQRPSLRMNDLSLSASPRVRRDTAAPDVCLVRLAVPRRGTMRRTGGCPAVRPRTL
jgi:Reverse transcriptase (RNA-dependent DNA polymerase)